MTVANPYTLFTFIFSAVLFSSLFSFGSLTAHADSLDDNDTLFLEETTGDVDIEASITNANEDFGIDLNEISSETLKTFSTTEIIEKEYEVDFAIPSSQMQTRASTGSNKTEGGVKAVLNVTYVKNSKGDVNITKVTGSWAPTSNLYSLSGRQVVIRSGNFAGGGKAMNKYPTANSFSYGVSWGYVTYFPNTSYSMSGANSFADIKVSGMSGTHEISLKVAI